MRELSNIEKNIIQKIAQNIAPALRTQLLWDMEHAKAEPANKLGSRILFLIQDYPGASIKGQHAYPAEGTVKDCDGKEIAIWLYADANNRLYELEFCKWDATTTSEPISPDWTTLNFY